MEATSVKPFAGPRFWRWYAAGCLYLTGLYTVVFLITAQDPVPKALLRGLINALPMAILGTIVLFAFRRMDWSRPRRPAFVAVHLLMALVFGTLSTLLSYVLYWIVEGIYPEVFGEIKIVFEYFVWETVMGMLIYGILFGVCYAMLLHGRVREEEARASKAKALQTEAELRALRAQLNPHFLFNTLHSLLALVRHDARAAEDALEQFGDLLRYTLDTQKNGEVVPLRDEMAFVANYLALESLRLGDRLRLDVRFDAETGDHPIPAFTVQPVVENAIRHAVAPRTSGGHVEVDVSRQDDHVVIRVADDGPGARLAEVGSANGLGLRLVRERLAAHHGDDAVFEVDTCPEGGFRVTMKLPVDGEDD